MKAVIQSGKLVVLSREAYLCFLTFDDRFNSPSAIAADRRASALASDTASRWSKNGDRVTYRCKTEDKAFDLAGAFSEVIRRNNGY